MAAKKKQEQPLSINALHERTGIDRRTIKKRLKEQGLDPSKPHKLSAVLEVIKPPEPQAGSSIREQKTFEEWRKLKIANDAREGELVSKSEIVEALRKAATKACDILDNTLVNECPPKIVAHEEVANARTQIKRYVDDAKKALQGLSKLFDA